jgi:hypothetical protein
MESTWLACRDADEMLQLLAGRASDRKRRLFVVAACRRVWRLLTDARSRAVVEAGEQFADGAATAAELRSAYEAAPGGQPAANVASCAGMADASMAARWVTGSFAALAAAGVRKAAARTRVAAGRPLCVLLRELFGNPFRAVTVAPAWLSWHGAIVPRLAQAAYEERHLPSGLLDNTRLAILADALEEAGCTEPLVLGHLRSGAEHLRGCFVVDALLGKS